MLLIVGCLIFYISVFSLVGTKIPKRITGILSAISLVLIGCTTFNIFQSSDFKDVENALYVFMFLVFLGGLVVGLIGLHWAKREELVETIDKAEKKIKLAKKWFFLGSDKV